MRIDAEIVVAAPPGVVWDLLANITNTGNWSPECIRTAWLDGHHDARPGVRFSGRNRALGGFEWTVTCVITEADRPRTLEWVVLDDEDALRLSIIRLHAGGTTSIRLWTARPSSGTASCTGPATAASAG